MHIEQHKIRILNQCFHLSSKTCNSRTIQHSMIGRNTKVNRLSRYEITFLLSILRVSVCFTNRNDSGLRTQNSRHEVATTNIADG